MPKKNFIFSFLMIPALAAVLAACNLPQTAQEAAQENTEAAPEEEAPVESEFQELRLLDNSLWVQQGSTVFVAFYFENPNPDLVFEDVEYTVSLYDADHNEIENDSAMVRWIFPNQTLGLSFNFYLLDQNASVESANVSWDYASIYNANGAADPLTATDTAFWQNGDQPMATGKINNSAPDTYTAILANIICYNQAGEIVGGGTTLVDFIPGNNYAGFAMYVDTFEPVASVEVFPVFTENSLRYEGTSFWSEITILRDYFYPTGPGFVMGGLEIQSNVNTVLRDSIVYITFYDEQGRVTSTATDSVDILLPNSALGVAPWVSTPPEGSGTTTYDIFVLPGEFDNEYELQDNPFFVNSAVLTGDMQDTVRVNFTNTYSKPASEVDVNVLLLDAAGNIIGGGADWTTEPIPAGGTTEIEVWVDYDPALEVASIQVWVTPNYWTAFE